MKNGGIESEQSQAAQRNVSRVEVCVRVENGSEHKVEQSHDQCRQEESVRNIDQRTYEIGDAQKGDVEAGCRERAMKSCLTERQLKA